MGHGGGWGDCADCLHADSHGMGDGMTTIAFKDGIIAWDSQQTWGDMIVSSNVQKMIKSGRQLFWGCGSVAEIKRLSIAIFSGEKKLSGEDTAGGMFWDGGKLYLACVQNEQVVLSETIKGCCYAIGSGSEYAMGAMDAGEGAPGAVLIASQRDVYTGGRIRHKILFNN